MAETPDILVRQRDFTPTAGFVRSTACDGRETRGRGAVASQPTPPAPPGPRRGAGGARHPPSHGPGAASRPGRVFSPARPPNRQNVRQEAQGQMRRPPSPRAPFVIAPAQGRLARLDAGCSRPAPAAPPDQPGPRGVRRGMAPSGLQCPSPHLPPPDQPALRPRQPSADGAHPPRDASGPARPLATFLTGLPRPPADRHCRGPAGGTTGIIAQPNLGCVGNARSPGTPPATRRSIDAASSTPSCGRDRRRSRHVSPGRLASPRPTPGRRAPTGPLQEAGLDHRWRLTSGPHMALGCTHGAIPRRPHPPLDALRTRGRQQGIDLGCTGAHADHTCLGTPLGGTGPPVWGQQSQGDTRGRDRQRTLDEPALTGRRATGPHALGRPVACPVDCGGLLPRPPQGNLVKAAVGRLEMAGKEVLRRAGVGTGGGGGWARTPTRSTRRVVRRTSPRSPSAQALTAQLVSSA